MLIVAPILAAMQLMSPPLSEAAQKRIMAARNPTEISRAFAAKCGETAYSMELRSEFSGKGVKLIKFERVPKPFNDWTRETVASSFDTYSDVFAVRFLCGVEREGKADDFLLLDISGYSRADSRDAAEKCRQKSGLFRLETRALVEIAEDYAAVLASEIGSCVTEESIRENRRLNEGPEL